METESHRQGAEIENIAEIFLNKEGFQILCHASDQDQYSPFDFLVERNETEYLVEVKRKNINTASLNKLDRTFDFGHSQYDKLKKSKIEVIILIGWVTEDNRIGFKMEPLTNFHIKANRIKGLRLKLDNSVNYSPIENPEIYKSLNEWKTSIL
jgi:hypothetical protein